MKISEGGKGMEKINAKIEDVRIQSVYDIWMSKPPGLRFCDTDVLTIAARTDEGEEVKDTFFFALKPDGTFAVNTPHTISRLRRKRLAEFLRYYNIAENVEKYNLRKGIEEWKGKKIEVVKSNGRYIFVPEKGGEKEEMTPGKNESAVGAIEKKDESADKKE
jgi:hypothetical protein